MLVLTRKQDQKVVIPGLDISIQVVSCRSSSVTLGFQAPPEIRILRDELDSGIAVDDALLRKFLEDKIAKYSGQKRHDVRDQLNTLVMALQVLLDDIQTGELSTLDDVFESVHQRLRGLNATLDDDNAAALVIEDQANERELLAGILRMNGYRVATAADGDEALQYIDEHGLPAFVLVDMNMPRCGGEEFVRQLRESADLEQCRIYVVSGCTEDECNLAEDTIDGWHTKPVRPQQLLKAMAAG